ncbi:transposase (plasmid) [Caballeronia sp. S22]
MGEFGLIVPQGIAHIAQRVPELIEDACNELPGAFRLLSARLLDRLQMLHRQVDEIEDQIKAWHRNSEASQRLEKVPGIGPLTATALVATIGHAKNFDNGRQLAAWLGLVPRHHSSGGKQNLLGMSKRGDAYLRTMLIHGAKSVICQAMQKADPKNWVFNVVARRNKNVAAVAVANKTARTIWAMLVHDRQFRADFPAASAAA